MRKLLAHRTTLVSMLLLVASWALAGERGSHRIQASVVDFDMDANHSPILAGQVIDNEYAADGLKISVTNNFPGHPNLGIAFDSSLPTGGDYDLGTPHHSFGGPGLGAGGAEGQPGQNDTAFGNLLIIAENAVDSQPADKRVDDPDDESAGGQICFAFDMPVRVISITIVDMAHDEPGSSIETLETGGGGITIPVPTYGENSVQTIHIERNGVEKVTLNLAASGGVARIEWMPATVAVEERTWTQAKQQYRD